MRGNQGIFFNNRPATTTKPKAPLGNSEQKRMTIEGLNDLSRNAEKALNTTVVELSLNLSSSSQRSQSPQPSFSSSQIYFPRPQASIPALSHSLPPSQFPYLASKNIQRLPPTPSAKTSKKNEETDNVNDSRVKQDVSKTENIQSLLKKNLNISSNFEEDFECKSALCLCISALSLLLPETVEKYLNEIDFFDRPYSAGSANNKEVFLNLQYLINRAIGSIKTIQTLEAEFIGKIKEIGYEVKPLMDNGKLVFAKEISDVPSRNILDMA